METENYDLLFANGVIGLMEKNNVSNTLLSALLKLKTSTVSELLQGKVGWKLKHIVSISLYFGVPVDTILFGDSEFVVREAKNNIYGMKSDIREYLIKEKKFNTLGKLEGSGYFDDLNKPKKL